MRLCVKLYLDTTLVGLFLSWRKTDFFFYFFLRQYNQLLYPNLMQESIFPSAPKNTVCFSLFIAIGEAILKHPVSKNVGRWEFYFLKSKTS